MTADFAGQGLRLRLGPGWQQIETGPEVVLAAISTEQNDSGFRPTVVMTKSVIGSLDAVRWAAGTSAVLAEQLAGFLLLDAADDRIGGLPSHRLLISYVDQAERDLTLEQWSVVDAGEGIALSFTCATEDYPRFRAAARAIADTVEVAR